MIKNNSTINTKINPKSAENLAIPVGTVNHRFSVAPMLDWTDRHARYFLRLLTKNALLYTEMVTTGAIIHGDRERHLQFNQTEHPVAVQLGGSNLSELSLCSRICEDYGYDEINLNVGCPSDRVQSGAFGACLMAQPNLVAACYDAMSQACKIPVTIKCRIGIDDQDEYKDLQQFIHTVSQAGCSTFIVHARKAWLKGLSPKQNRDIPPLNYQRVYQLKEEFPELNIILNGGITTIDECQQHLTKVDGVMMGREAYNNPYCLAQIDNRLYGNNKVIPSRREIVIQLLPYIEQLIHEGGHLKYISRHILGIFQGIMGARAWRRHISENAYKPKAGVEIITQALSFIQEQPTDNATVIQ